MSGGNLQTERLARRQRLLGPAYRLFYREPLHLVKGEGAWLWDNKGRRYLDMYNNVPHVGHCHPEVVKAITCQLGQLNTHTRYLHDTVLDYAEKLTALFAPEQVNAMFSCSGSEANELAIRIARACSGAQGLIVTDNAYHGTTTETFAISTEDIPAEQIPDYVETVPAPDTFRGSFQDAQAGLSYAALIDDAIERLRARGYQPAAFIADSILSSDGIIDTPAGYLKSAAERIRAAGGYYIADEVQPGLGRLGTHYFAFQRDAVQPDIVTLGKPLGNGYPVAATIARAELVEQFSERLKYFNTFGGNPVAAAAGLAVITIVERDQLQSHALRIGQYLNRQLHVLAEQFPEIGDIRGSGLFQVVDLVSDVKNKTPAGEMAEEVVEGLLGLGVLTSRVGREGNILKLRPPMVVGEEEIDFFIAALKQTLSDVLDSY